MVKSISYSSWKRIALPVVFPAGITILLSFLSAFYLAIPFLESQLINAKKEMIRELTNSSWSIINEYNESVLCGELSLEEAKTNAKRQIEKIRYGPENKDYFWINDMHPRMIMHPYRKDLNDQDVTDFTDPQGKHLFVAFVETVRTSGAGFVDYHWQHHDDESRIVPKLSYVRAFTPWGWIIGTGIYINDVNERIAEVTNKATTIFVHFFILIALLTFVIIFQGQRAEKKSKRIAQSLERSEREYRSLFDDSYDAIYSRSLSGKILMANKAFADLFQYSLDELKGLPVNELYGEQQARIEFEDELREKGALREYPLDLKRKDGTVIDALVTVRLRKGHESEEDSVIGIIRDITESKRLEQQLFQAQKMEAIGRLAGGIAHDFNNLLTVIIGFSELQQMKLRPEDPLYEGNLQVLRTAENASELTRQLLVYSRHHVVTKKILNINETLDKMEKMLRRMIREEIELIITKDDDLWLIEHDPVQVEQVIMNLVVNASDAMPKGGRIVIRTSNYRLDEDSTLHETDLPEGDYIILSVTDSGIGISKSVQEKIFEPFFSTKSPDEGTGLGLSTVYGILKRAKGDVLVSSSENEGTTFTILIPRTVSREPVTSEADESKRKLDGTETILVVEDDENIRKFVVRTLQIYGYKTIAAEDGEEALDLYLALDEPVDLILSDVIMPKMNGVDLVRQLRQQEPSLKTLFISGYSNDLLELEAIDELEIDILQKPFGPQKLLRKIREILDS